MQKKALVYDIGGTKIECAVISADGKLLESKKIRTPAASWREGKKALVDLGKEFLKRHPTIQICGLSAAGPLHAPSGTLMSPTNMNWGHVEITKELSTSLGVDVVLENDAAAAVLAEHWRGDARGTPDLVSITLGTGLGVGVIISHELLRGGHDGMHPEIGHLMLDIDGHAEMCGCGNRGCAEAYLAGSHFLKRAREALEDSHASISFVIDRAQVGDKKILGLFEDYSRRMAQFLASLIVSYYPKKFILAGSFAKGSSLFLPRAQFHLRNYLSDRLLATPELWPEILISSLDNPGLWGAAQLAFQNKTSLAAERRLRKVAAK